MKKIVEIIPFYSLDEAISCLQNEDNQIALHHLWGYDQINKNGFAAKCVEFNNETLLNRIGWRRLGITNLQQQLECLTKAKEYDAIFDPFMKYSFLLVLLRLFGIFNKPIIAIAQRAYTPHKKNWLKKFKHYLVRYIYFKGVDSILFVNETIYDHYLRHSDIKGNAGYLRSWGVDLDFFSRYAQQQPTAPTSDYIYTTGGSARDFDTLIEAFHGIDFQLKITAREDFRPSLKSKTPNNVSIDTSITPGLRSTGLLRKEYYNSLAVVVPLVENAFFCPYGITVLMEAMAMKKPVITTRNKAYPFDVEKEGIGINVDYGDVEGWRRAINYLIEHPQEAREMGERGFQLSQEKYNYQLFSDELIAHIHRVLQ